MVDTAGARGPNGNCNLGCGAGSTDCATLGGGDAGKSGDSYGRREQQRGVCCVVLACRVTLHFARGRGGGLPCKTCFATFNSARFGPSRTRRISFDKQAERASKNRWHSVHSEVAATNSMGQSVIDLIVRIVGCKMMYEDTMRVEGETKIGCAKK